MIKKTILPNGIRLISEYMPGTFSTTIMVWVNVGPNDETHELNGISHFIEHMLFKGTKNRTYQEIVWPIEGTGGSINAFTEREYTCYYVNVLNDEIDTALDILMDMVFNSVYDAQNIELERQVVLEEIKMYEDTPDELVYDILMKFFWKGHPLSKPITGTIESVSNITRDDILDFVSNFYIPENTIISIAGSFDEDMVIDRISMATPGSGKSVNRTNVENPVANSGTSYCEKDIEQIHACIGAKGPSILSNDRYASAIVDICLGGCMASRLFQEIREKRGLVYCINTYESLFRPSGIFGVYAGMNPSNFKEVMALTMDEMFKIKDNLAEEEFNKAKIHIKGSLKIGLESTKNRAIKNGRSELYFNKVHTVEEMCSALDSVTQDDIQRVNNYMFDKNHMGLALVGPKGSVNKEFSLL